MIDDEGERVHWNRCEEITEILSGGSESVLECARSRRASEKERSFSLGAKLPAKQTGMIRMQVVQIVAPCMSHGLLWVLFQAWRWVAYNIQLQAGIDSFSFGSSRAGPPMLLCSAKTASACVERHS